MSVQHQRVRLNTEDFGPRVKGFLEILRKKVKGQEMALRDVAAAYEKYDSGLKKKDKPIFRGLFLGPSGVGKTLVSEILAEHLFGDRGSFCKIKCGDLKQDHQMASLIGSPPGYVGHQDPNDPNRYNEESPQPMLSQWNLDRYDSERLKKEHSEEREKFLARKKKYDENEKKNQIEEDELGKEIKNLQDEVTKLEKEVEALEKEQASTAKNRQWDIASKVNKLKTRLKTIKVKEAEMLRKLAEVTKARAVETEYMRKWYREMVDKGAIYDTDGPRAYTSIVLFDEIEKADESLIHMLFEIMDKGQLQLANGLTTSFRNTFLFMTGNVGEQEIADILSGNANIGFRQQIAADENETNDKIYKVAVDAAKKIFPAPFLGRLDKIIVFRPLKYETMFEILDVHIEELHKDFFEADKPLLIELEPPVKKFLVDQSMEDGRSAYGARNLVSRLDKFITNKLIRAIGNGSLKPPAEVYVKLEKVNGKQKVVFDSEEIKFPEESPEVKDNKTNP